MTMSVEGKTLLADASHDPAPAEAQPHPPPRGEKLLKMHDDIEICDQCQRPLMRIDRYGEDGCVALQPVRLLPAPISSWSCRRMTSAL